ncbi:hypothetical protein [Marinobacter alkaliphilus]|uniref:hypothetical protein n=1 Tax=Marinobacter alkaliphilus TaxID=254719 RepID=UPI003D76826A
MEELDLSWADLGGTLSGAMNTVVNGWAEGTANKLRGSDGGKAQPTTADQYDRTVVTPTDGSAQRVANEISGTLGDAKWWVIGAFALGVAAFVYSRS